MLDAFKSELKLLAKDYNFPDNPDLDVIKTVKFNSNSAGLERDISSGSTYLDTIRIDTSISAEKLINLPDGTFINFLAVRLKSTEIPTGAQVTISLDGWTTDPLVLYDKGDFISFKTHSGGYNRILVENIMYGAVGGGIMEINVFAIYGGQ